MIGKTRQRCSLRPMRPSMCLLKTSLGGIQPSPHSVSVGQRQDPKNSKILGQWSRTPLTPRALNSRRCCTCGARYDGTETTGGIIKRIGENRSFPTFMTSALLSWIATLFPRLPSCTDRNKSRQFLLLFTSVA